MPIPGERDEVGLGDGSGAEPITLRYRSDEELRNAVVDLSVRNFALRKALGRLISDGGLDDRMPDAVDFARTVLDETAPPPRDEWFGRVAVGAVGALVEAGRGDVPVDVIRVVFDVAAEALEREVP